MQIGAETGRFITSDPIGLAGGLNTYAYALANPLIYVDPLGLFVDFCDLLKALPDNLKGTMSAGAGAILAGILGATITDDSISLSGTLGFGGGKAAWKPHDGNLDIGIFKNWGGKEGAVNIGTKLEGSAGYILMGNASGEVGTNGLTLSANAEIGIGMFGLVGFTINGKVLDCKKEGCEH